MNEPEGQSMSSYAAHTESTRANLSHLPAQDHTALLACLLDPLERKRVHTQILFRSSRLLADLPQPRVAFVDAVVHVLQPQVQPSVVLSVLMHEACHLPLVGGWVNCPGR
jgi:hypothetical protein